MTSMKIFVTLYENDTKNPERSLSLNYFRKMKYEIIRDCAEEIVIKFVINCK